MDTRGENHVDDGVLLSLLDGELAVEERRLVEVHADGCAECAARRDELRFATRRATAALEATDVASPFGDLPDALRTALREAPVPIATARSARIGRSGRRSLATAAGLTLLLAAGAYAIPGSPVRGWIDDGIGTIATLIGGEEEETVAPGPSQVSVEPAGGEIRVSVIGATGGLRVTIALSDASTAAASARDASFRVASGRIEVSDASGDLSVTLPRSAVSASVDVDGVEVARLEGGVLTRSSGADTSPAEILVQTGG